MDLFTICRNVFHVHVDFKWIFLFLTGLHVDLNYFVMFRSFFRFDIYFFGWFQMYFLSSGRVACGQKLFCAFRIRLRFEDFFFFGFGSDFGLTCFSGSVCIACQWKLFFSVLDRLTVRRFFLSRSGRVAGWSQKEFSGSRREQHDIGTNGWSKSGLLSNKWSFFQLD